MRQFNGPTARPQPGDRNPITSANQYFAAGVAPHGPTARINYTVPAGKKAILNYVSVEMLRATAAAPVGLWMAYTRVTPISLNNSRPVNLQALTNGVGDRLNFSLGCNQVLLATEVFDAVSQDASTGGTVNYSISYGATEYDA